MRVILAKELCEGIYVQVKESTDARKKTIEIKSMLPISEELFLGCLLVFLENQAPDLTAIPTDGFDCH